MQKKDVWFFPLVDFKEQTPEILLKEEELDPLYVKAFLSRENKSETEYAQNTTARQFVMHLILIIQQRYRGLRLLFQDRYRF